MAKPTALAKTEPTPTLARYEELPVEAIVARVDKIHAVAKSVMKDGHHFGTIPGVNKPSLLKPGAEILCLTFQLAPTFVHVETRDGAHLEVIATCTLKHAPSGTELGSAIGSCSTREAKYAWRKGSAKCPACGVADALRRSKDKAEWYCWKKIGGCGKTYALNDATITGQTVGRVENPDLADTYNTVRKMADKRALVAAVLIVTCASDLFTQDVEEQGRSTREDFTREEAPPPDEGSEGTPPVGQSAPVAVVASDKDLADVLAAHAECTSTAELEAVSRAHRNRKWTRAQVATLRADYAKREASLNAAPPNPDDDGREPAEEAAS